MAARRLIAVMLVLLFLSSLAAALAPVDQQREETSTTTTEPLPKPATDEGKLITQVLDVGTKRPRTIKASVGDQLQLRVTAPRPATIELVGLGATEDVGPAAPALFDVLLDSAGPVPVRELESGRRVGTIEVSPRALTEPAPAPAPSRS